MPCGRPPRTKGSRIVRVIGLAIVGIIMLSGVIALEILVGIASVVDAALGTKSE